MIALFGSITGVAIIATMLVIFISPSIAIFGNQIANQLWTKLPCDFYTNSLVVCYQILHLVVEFSQCTIGSDDSGLDDMGQLVYLSGQACHLLFHIFFLNAQVCG